MVTGSPLSRVWAILTTATFSGPIKGERMKKFLLLLGILGLVIAILMYVRSRQGEEEF
jgi:hypothetical protein